MTPTTTKYLYLVATLVAYWLACFAPYKWVTPLSYQTNDAQGYASEAQPLTFGGQGMAQLVLPDNANPRAPAQLRLMLDIECGREQQTGPARIVSYSKSTSERNFMLGHEGRALVLRWLRPGSDSNGLPAYRVENFFDRCRSRTLELLAADGGFQLKSNDAILLEVPAPDGSMARWSFDHPMILGNETSWDRGWQGTLHALRLEVDGQTIAESFAAVTLPPGAWLLSDHAKASGWHTLVPFSTNNPVTLLDNVLNVIGFVPFGALLAALWPGRINALRAGLYAACLSLSIEIFQLGFEGRHPSATDLMTNTFGGLLGFLFARVWLGRVWRRRRQTVER